MKGLNSWEMQISRERRVSQLSNSRRSSSTVELFSDERDMRKHEEDPFILRRCEMSVGGRALVSSEVGTLDTVMTIEPEDRTVRRESRLRPLTMASAQLDSVTRSHVADIKRDTPWNTFLMGEWDASTHAATVSSSSSCSRPNSRSPVSSPLITFRATFRVFRGTPRPGTAKQLVFPSSRVDETGCLRTYRCHLWTQRIWMDMVIISNRPRFNRLKFRFGYVECSTIAE